MKATILRMSLLAGLLLLGAIASADDRSEQLEQTNARAEIDKAQAEYRAALLDADITKLAKLWTDDYTFTNGRGMFLTRADRLNNIKTGATELTSIKETGREVRFYGDDTAIITGKVTLKAKYSGQPSTGDYRYLNVWLKRGDRWKMAANQVTLIME
jgi:uncharacterized protein (TIGR02246 family)